MQETHFFIRYRLHYLLIGLLVFAIWFFLRVDDYARPATAFWVTLIKVADLSLLVWIVNSQLIPRLLYRKRYLLFTGCFLLLIFLSSIAKMYIIGEYTHNPALYDWTLSWKKRVYDNVLPHIFLVTAGAAVKLLLDYGKLQKRLAETAKEKAEAELNFLKSQINPHFVFNSLNAVYFLIDRENTAARNALHRFSDLLRYQLYEMGGSKLAIEKEIKYLQDYISLQQLRMDEKYDIRFTADKAVAGFSIEPLLLIPLVENAFKHVSHHRDRRNEIRVQLYCEGNRFLCKVENTCEEQLAEKKSGGIGLKNVQRRLELLYPGTHQLQIMASEHRFVVTLSIELL